MVTIYDVAERDGKSFIVMELLRGGTVADRLRAGEDIPHRVALRWLEEAGSALDAAHEAGVVHRDVKPANMLLDDNGRLALADFGIARLGLEDQITQTGQVLGTAAYLSPEQAMGEPSTPASDRYALAVVAFELLTGGSRSPPRTSPPRPGRTSTTSRHWPPSTTSTSRRPSTACSCAAWPRTPPSAGRAPGRWSDALDDALTAPPPRRARGRTGGGRRDAR